MLLSLILFSIELPEHSVVSSWHLHITMLWLITMMRQCLDLWHQICHHFFTFLFFSILVPPLEKISVELLAFVTSWTHQWAYIVLLSFYLTPRKLIYMNYFVGALCHLKVENLRRKCRLNPKWKAYKIKRCEIQRVFTCACVPKNRYLQELLKWKEWKEKERNTCWMNCSRKKHLRKMLMQ